MDTSTSQIDLPGKFCEWLDGTNLAQGLDDVDPECKETRIAYDEGHRIESGNGYYVRMQASPTVLNLLAEYAGNCLEANRDEPVKSEMTAARKLLKRIRGAQRMMKGSAG